MTTTTRERLLQSRSAIEAAARHAGQYLTELPDRRVGPTRAAVQSLEALDTALPEHPNDPCATLELLNDIAGPATTGTAGGRFFGLVVGGALPASAGARVLNAAWDQVATMRSTSAAAVEVEKIAGRWILEALNLPAGSAVSFVTGATMANMVCIATARNTLLARKGWDHRKQGLTGAPKIRIVASEEIHSTVIKVCGLLSFGTDTIEWCPTDGNGAIQIDKVPALDDGTIVLAQAGNVNSGSFDPLAELATKCDEVGSWLHVDGAFGLWARASQKRRDLAAGAEGASSWVTDGHKWLNTPYDCGIAICRHAEAVHDTMSILAPYLMAGAEKEPKDLVLELSRAARSFEVWAALHSLGRLGVADLVDNCCQYAQVFEAGLRKLGFEILNDVVLNQVVATLPGKEDRMADLSVAVIASGEAWFGVTKWKGRDAIRISVSSWATTRDDVDRTLAAIESAKAAL